MGMHMPCVKQQWSPVCVMLAALNLTNEQQVVALFMLTQIAAFKDRCAAFQKWHAMHRVMMGRMAESIGTLACKQFCDRLLGCRQHMHRVMRALAKHGQRTRHQPQTPQHQRRSQGDRIKRADGGSHRMALCAARRDDGDTRGELAQRIAEFALREWLGSTQDRGRQG